MQLRQTFKLKLVAALVLLIAWFDLALVQTGLFQSNLQTLTAAIALDFVVVLPLLVYFLVYRAHKKSIASILPLALAGYLILLVMLPEQSGGILEIVKYTLIPLELLYLGLVSYRLIGAFRRGRLLESHPIDAISKGADEAFGHSKASRLLAHELTVLYYALFSWRKSAGHSGRFSSFTYHESSGGLLILLILVKILLLEGIAFHFLLMQWMPLAAWLLTLSNVYVLLLLIADYRAMRLSPIVLTPERLMLRYGLKLRVSLPLEQIDCIRQATAGELSKEQLKKAVAPPTTEPNIAIHMKHPVTVTRMFGMQESVECIHLYIDEPGRFEELCRDAARGKTVEATSPSALKV